MNNEITKLFSLLAKHGYMLASAESLTGGLFGASLCNVPGASSVYQGGIIVYTRDAKEQLLGIDPRLLDKYGMVSPECATAMAENLYHKMKVNIAISFTGNAGPSALEDKPVGLVYVGLKINDEKVITKELNLAGGRNAIRTQVVHEGIKLITNHLK